MRCHQRTIFKQSLFFDFASESSDNQKRRDEDNHRREAVGDHRSFQGRERLALIGDCISYLRSDHCSARKYDGTECLLSRSQKTKARSFVCVCGDQLQIDL